MEAFDVKAALTWWTVLRTDLRNEWICLTILGLIMMAMLFWFGIDETTPTEKHWWYRFGIGVFLIAFAPVEAWFKARFPDPPSQEK